MRVRCRATADYRSNAIGPVELECAPDGLRIALCGVSSYREGYAPGPPAQAPDVLVPWGSVYATQLGEQALLLSVDARILPQNRFLLRSFTERRPEAEDAGSTRRAFGLLALVLGLLALGLLLGALDVLPHPEVFRTFGLALLLVTLVVLGLHHARRDPEPSSEQVLGELSRELSGHLPNHVPIQPPEPPPRRFVLRELMALLPRSAVGISISLAAATLAALVGSSAARPNPGALGAPEPASAPPATSATAESAKSALAPQPELPGPSFGEPCQCRHDEPFGGAGRLPRLSPLLVASQNPLHDGHRHFQLEVALVNNSAEPAAHVSLSVVFFEELGGGQQGQRQSGERPLYFAGPLLPGHMIKWHVEGRGTSFDIVGPDVGNLAEDGSDAARGEAWDELASARSRVFRLHTMRVFSFIADPRLSSLAESLRPDASESELELLDRLSRKPSAVVACAIGVQHLTQNEWRLNACLDNHSDEPGTRLALRLLAYDAPLAPDRLGAVLPEVLAEHTAPLRGTLPPRSGRRVELAASFPLEGGVSARAFEVLVDRQEYLH